MADSTIALVDFHGDQLLAVRQGADVFVAINPICQALGVSVRGQRKRIENDLILSEGRTLTILPPAFGGQEMVMLRLQLVSGWLFGIDAKRVKEEARDKVLTYQRECYAVLYSHFHPSADDIVDAWGPKRALVAEVRLCFGERAACALYIKLGLPTTPEFFRQGELAI